MSSFSLTMGNPNKMRYGSNGNAYGDGWHTYPGMSAGGTLTFTRSSRTSKTISVSGTITNKLASAGNTNQYGYQIKVRVYVDNTQKEEITFEAPGKNYNTFSKQVNFSFENTTGGTVYVYYYCTDSGIGKCTSKYPTPKVLVASANLGTQLPYGDKPGKPTVSIDKTSVNDYNTNTTISWTAPANNGYSIDKYEIYRSINGGSFTLLTTTTSTSYTENIPTSVNRGSSVRYQVYAHNAKGYSAVSNTVGCTVNNASVTISNVTAAIQSASFKWSSTARMKALYYNLNKGAGWIKVFDNDNTTSTSGTVNITGLTYNTAYNITLHLYDYVKHAEVTKSISVQTPDIARFASVGAEWNIETSEPIKITNPTKSVVKLVLQVKPNGKDYQDYADWGKINAEDTSKLSWDITLSQEIQDKMYKDIASDTNVKARFKLVTYNSSGTIVDTVYSSEVTLIFPTKAWVKVNNTWKRAYVWAKVGGTWKKVNPWVDPNKNKNWKRI